jgi:superfamily II DNA or RNA helicase
MDVPDMGHPTKEHGMHIEIRQTSVILTYKTASEQRSIASHLDSKYALKDWANKKRGQPPVTKATYWLEMQSKYVVHKGSLEPLMQSLRNKGLQTDNFTIEYSHLTPKTPVDIEMTTDVTLRPEQIKPWAFIMDHKARSYSANLLGLFPGGGKTLLGIKRMCELKLKTCMIMRPGYIPQWKREILKHTNITKDEIFFVDKGPKMKKLINMDQEELDSYKLIFMSNKTLLYYFKAYYDSMIPYTDAKFSLRYTPFELMDKLGIESILIDETHEDLHLNFLIQLYFDVEDFIGLSGTFISLDRFVLMIQECMYPLNNRFSALRDNPYIHYVIQNYFMQSDRRIVTKYYGNNAYNHAAYETWLMKNSALTDKYFEVIISGLKHAYFNRRKQGQKVMVYFAKVEMIQKFIDFMKKTQSEFNYLQFVAGVSYESIYDADVIVSTLGKASTALDIEGLITLYITTNRQSIQSNIQTISRLRDVEGEIMICVQMNNIGISKHEQYQTIRDRLLGGLCVATNIIEYNSPL